MDAIRQIDTVLNRQHSPEWILEGDIKGCFEHISHDWLLKMCIRDRVMRQPIWAFENYLLANKNTEQPVLHISLSPSLDDRLTDSQFADLAKEYMQKMGYGDQPYIDRKSTRLNSSHSDRSRMPSSA